MRKILISTLATIGLMAATLAAYAAPYDADPMVIEFSVEQSVLDADALTFAVLTADPIDLPASNADATASMLGPGPASKALDISNPSILAASKISPHPDAVLPLFAGDGWLDPSGTQPA